MKRFFRIFLLYVQHVFQYRARSFMWFIIAFINPLVLLLFWQGILANKPDIGGWNAERIYSYYLLLVIAQALLQHHLEYVVAYGDIKRGDLMRELLKPFSYLRLRLISETPWRLTQGIYAIVTIALLSYLFHKSIQYPHDVGQIVPLIIITVNAFFISFFFKMIVSFSAFWLTNIEGLMDTNDILTIMFSGLVLPLNLFPAWAQTIANFTPYPYVLYYPVASFIGMQTTPELYRIVLIQFGWIALLYVTTQVMWKKGIRQFTGVGQ